MNGMVGTYILKSGHTLYILGIKNIKIKNSMYVTELKKRDIHIEKKYYMFAS